MRVAEERRAQLKKLAEEDRQAKAIQRALYEAKQKGQMAEDAISSVMSPDDKTGAAFDMVRRVQKPEGRSQLLKSVGASLFVGSKHWICFNWTVHSHNNKRILEKHVVKTFIYAAFLA